MIAILTGDIINSRDSVAIVWIDRLKTVLNMYGKSPKQWEIFRGDSFQLSIEPKKALLAAFHIKAAIKLTEKQDIRIAIGLGSETYQADRITESNGSAYVYSGECFESLKKQTLGIKSENIAMNETLNIMFNLALLTANSWTSVVAEVITAAIEHPNKNQKEIAKLIGKSQSSVSEALKRGGFEEIMKINNFYQKQLSAL